MYSQSKRMPRPILWAQTQREQRTPERSSKESRGNVFEPVKAAGSLSGSLRMRLLESVRVTVFEREVPILLFTSSLSLEILLRHHVQVSGRRQLCARRRLLSRFFADPVSRPFLRCSAVSRAMSVECRHATHDERRRSHHHKKTHRFELSGHDSGKQPYTILAGPSQLEC